MRPYIGQKVIYKRSVYLVHDTNNLKQTAYIGVPDENNFIWDTFEVWWTEIRPANASENFLGDE